MIYGYARVSTAKQKLERQVQNIKQVNDTAVIVDEKYTGTTQDRPQWNKLKKILKEGDVVIFDEISRMSRNAEEGFAEYKELFERGVSLVFVKQRHLDTACFQAALETGVPMTGTDVDLILRGVNEYMLRLAAKQIEIAFESAEQEVEFLHQRISEGIIQAKLDNKQIGRRSNIKVETQKAKDAKEIIKKFSKAFDGSLNDPEVIKLAGISRNSYYKYKAEIKYDQTVINNFKIKPFEFLSNFAECEIVYNGVTYPSVEHAYQAAKATTAKEHDDIATAKSPNEARKKGRRVKIDKKEWAARQDIIMEELLRIKFGQPEFRSKLLQTGSRPLEESNWWHDQHYGNCTCPKCKDIPGENMLGKLLMKIRAEIMEEEQTQG